MHQEKEQEHLSRVQVYICYNDEQATDFVIKFAEGLPIENCANYRGSNISASGRPTRSVRTRSRKNRTRLEMFDVKKMDSISDLVMKVLFITFVKKLIKIIIFCEVLGLEHTW